MVPDSTLRVKRWFAWLQGWILWTRDECAKFESIGNQFRIVSYSVIRPAAPSTKSILRLDGEGAHSCMKAVMGRFLSYRLQITQRSRAIMQTCCMQRPDRLRRLSRRWPKAITTGDDRCSLQATGEDRCSVDTSSEEDRKNDLSCAYVDFCLLRHPSSRQ